MYYDRSKSLANAERLSDIEDRLERSRRYREGEDYRSETYDLYRTVPAVSVTYAPKPDGAPSNPKVEGLPPPAVMGFEGNVLTVCAWCESKDDATAWGEARGYQISHGICAACKPVHFPELVEAEQASAKLLESIGSLRQKGSELLQAMREARARLLGISEEELDARDRAVEAARPNAKAEAARLGISEQEYLDYVGEMEISARQEAMAESLREAEDRERRSMEEAESAPHWDL